MIFYFNLRFYDLCILHARFNDDAHKRCADDVCLLRHIQWRRPLSVSVTLNSNRAEVNYGRFLKVVIEMRELSCVKNQKRR